MEIENKEKKILYSSFNQDNNYFLVGTKEGCTIFKTDPFKKGFKLKIEGEFSIVSMLNKTNIFGLVGCDRNPKYKQTDVIIWDDLNKKIIYKYNIKKKVLNLKLRIDKIIVVCYSVIYVFNLNDFQLIDIIKTGPNHLGLIAVSYKKEKTILVYPSNEEDKGQLTIKNYEAKNFIYLNPHYNKVSYIEISNDGSLLATASEEGIKIRIFETKTGKNLDELYRGSEKADIRCISIDLKNRYVAASSERGTIHIWSLSQAIENIEKSIENKIEKKNKISNVHEGYIFKVAKSFSQVNLEEPNSIFCFGEEKQNTLIIITSTGKYYKARIDINKGGECKIVDENKLI